MDIKALRALSYGLYIVSSKKGDKINAQIANTVIQISNDPPTIAVSINKDNLTNEYIGESGVFTVSVLSEETQLSLIGHFGFNSGRNMDKFAEIDYKLGDNGAPYLEDNILAFLEAEVISETDAGTHTIFIGKLTNAQVLSEGNPMTYAYYHQVKKGGTPKTAPTTTTNGKDEVEMAKYLCAICGYIYDPEAGDPDNNVVPGTSFDDVPEDWVCPICGAGKEAFEKQD